MSASLSSADKNNSEVNTSYGEGKAEQQRVLMLTSGETVEHKGTIRIGLGPKPVNTGREPVSVTHFLSQYTPQFIEFSQVNASVPIMQLFVWMRVSILCMFFYGVYWSLTAAKYSLVSLPLTLPVLLALCFWFWHEQKDLAQESASVLPLRFHGQRQAVMLSRLKQFQPPKRPQVWDKDSTVALMFASYLLLGVGGVFLLSSLYRYFIEAKSIGLDEVLWCGLPLILGSFACYKFIKPWRVYWRQLKVYQAEHGKDEGEELVSVPWEQVRVEYQSSSLMNLWGGTSMQKLVFSAPIMADKAVEYNIAAVAIPVHSRDEAFSLYETIRQYMLTNGRSMSESALSKTKVNNDKSADSEHNADSEQGANSEQRAQPTYNREGYKRHLAKRWKQSPVMYVFWRLWYWLTLRYLAHVMLEYQHDVYPKKVRNRGDIKAWSVAIPESEWQTTSVELMALNDKLESLYAQGYSWESEAVQDLLAKQRNSKA
ncbi:hypothetical protein [uncultured Shewanella sp.]|uniref:hypothetical protein n=1 Tax=uncultured Shewanella sp. TaxID=173975 RepID=UPI00260EA5CF|nr:hypothetical protein [uncultured Shewanella sp.]